MSEIVTYLTYIFIASSVVLFITGRYAHPSLPAYIVAGIVLGFIIDGTKLLPLVQLGIVFLVFLFGIKTEQDRIAELTDESISTTFIQIFAIAALVYLVAYGFGASNLNALYLSIAAALSSSLIGLGLVEEELRMNLLHGRLTESINLMQDLIGIFLIIAVTTRPLELHPVLVNILYGAMIIVGALIIRSHVFSRIADRAKGSRELFMLLGMAVLTGFVFLTEYLGLSVIVGAFAAGIAVSEYPHRVEMMDIMGPLKDFFAAIFFVVLGVLVTVTVPTVTTLIIAVSLIGITTFVKPALTTILLARKGYDNRTAFLTSMGIDHVSEFALIVAIQAFVAGAMAPSVFQSIIIAAVVTMVVSAYTSRHAEELYQRLRRYNFLNTNREKLERQTHITQKLEDHIILVGYGVQGKLIADKLADLGEVFVVVDNDPEEITEANRHEENTLFGNVLDDHTWERSYADSARLIISTIPHIEASEAILDVDTDADIILRANTFNEAQYLLNDGASYVDVPDLMAADQLTAILRTVLTNRDHLEGLRERNLKELRDYFYSSDEP